MPVVVSALVVLGLLAVASRRAPRSAPLADPNAGLAAWVSDLYARIGQALPIAPAPLEFSAVVPNAASDGQRILVNLDWVRATVCAPTPVAHRVGQVTEGGLSGRASPATNPRSFPYGRRSGGAGGGSRGSGKY